MTVGDTAATWTLGLFGMMTTGPWLEAEEVIDHRAQLRTRLDAARPALRSDGDRLGCLE